MSNKLIAKELLMIAKNLICFDTLKTARGQGRIRDEIQKSKAECLKTIKIPKELPGINVNEDGVWVLHHMDKSKKYKLNGNMTLSEFKSMVDELENGSSNGELKKFKEELDSIIFLPQWFHKYIHSKNFNSSQFNTRDELYNELDRMTTTLEKFRLEGEKIGDWFDILKDIDNTIKIKSTDCEKIKTYLRKVHKIMISNVLKKTSQSKEQQ